MPRRLNRSLLVLGLTLIFISLAVLAYTLWPVEISHLQATLEPTLFVAP